VKILWMVPFLPYPPDAGGSIRVYELLRRCASEVQVDLVCHTSSMDPESVAALQALCASVTAIPWRRQALMGQAPLVAWRLLRGQPYQTKYANSAGLRQAVRRLSAASQYDVAVVEHSYMAHLLDCLPQQQRSRSLLSFHNVGFQQYRRMYLTERNAVWKLKHLLTWLPMRRWEPKMASRYRKVVLVSEDDRALLQAHCPDVDAEVVPNGVDTKRYKPIPLKGKGLDMLMVGALGYGPNADGVRYFYREVFPAVRTAVPGCSLSIVGKSPPADIVALDGVPQTSVHADVPEVLPYYQKARVALAPLRAGGGTRLKILEAMALGVPVVATTVGCEGLHARPDREVAIGDTPGDFARKTIELLTSDSYWHGLADGGRELVERDYDWDKLAMRLLGIYRQVSGKKD
jgi:glycosyltransferase involved in cell wall biosynthesis